MTSSHYCRYLSLMAQVAPRREAKVRCSPSMKRWLICRKSAGRGIGLNDVLATDIVLTIRQRLFAEAEAKELAVRDFACTFWD